jgi:hypothetical protein
VAALDGALRKTCFGRGYGHVISLAMERINIMLQLSLHEVLLVPYANATVTLTFQSLHSIRDLAWTLKELNHI